MTDADLKRVDELAAISTDDPDMIWLIAQLREANEENESIRKEMIARRTLKAIMEVREDEIREADEWIARIEAFKNEYHYPTSQNYSFEESQRIVLKFFELFEKMKKDFGADKPRNNFSDQLRLATEALEFCANPEGKKHTDHLFSVSADCGDGDYYREVIKKARAALDKLKGDKNG